MIELVDVEKLGIPTLILPKREKAAEAPACHRCEAFRPEPQLSGDSSPKNCLDKWGLVNLITSGEDGKIKIWDQLGRKVLRAIRLSQGVAMFMGCTENGVLVCVVKARQKPDEPDDANRVLFFRMSDGKLLHAITLNERPSCAALNTKKHLLAFAAGPLYLISTRDFRFQDKP